MVVTVLDLGNDRNDCQKFDFMVDFLISNSLSYMKNIFLFCIFVSVELGKQNTSDGLLINVENYLAQFGKMCHYCFN